MRCRLLVDVAAFTMVAAAAAAGTADTGSVPVISQHSARVDGRVLRYSAEIGRITIRHAESGEPRGYMGYVAYRAPSASRERPISFVWNGGPGANSSLLHFSAAGPRRIDGTRLVDNSESWLSDTDIVMVDPIGTGFSRPAKPEYGAEFYNTRGDVNSVAEFIRAWLLQHDAEDRRVFLIGESWGAGRAAQVAHTLLKRGQPVAGLVMISGGWMLNTEYLPAPLRRALDVVDMASAAQFHGRTAPDLGNDPRILRRAAEAWARDVYAPALARVATLTEPERSAIVTDLARFTGLPSTRIDRATLLVSPRQFRVGLLAEQGREAYLFDLRRTAAHEDAGRASMLRYLRRDLGYRTDLPYIGLEPAAAAYLPNGIEPVSVGAQWDYATADVSAEERRAAIEAALKSGAGPPRLGPPLPATEEAVALNPGLRVLLAFGQYDSFFSCASSAELERRLPDSLRKALQFRCYAGGHAMYLDSEARVALAADVRALLSERALPPVRAASPP